MERGIDVYNGTGEVDWKAVKASGYDFAIMKASEGDFLRDKSLSRNLTGAAVAGLHTGAYHWMHALSAAEAKKEAAFFLETVRGCKMEYPVALDVEQEALLKLGRTRLTEAVLAWCDAVAAAGYYVTVYANLYCVRNYLDMEKLNKYDLWLAQYNNEMTYEKPDRVGMWQHSDEGRVNGVKGGKGDVDLNISYRDYPAIIRAGGYNNYPKPAPKLTLDTRSKTLKIGEIYEFLARGAAKPQVKATPWGVVHTEYVRDEGERGHKFRITGKKAGETVVQAELNGQIAQFPVTVKAEESK